MSQSDIFIPNGKNWGIMKINQIKTKIKPRKANTKSCNSMPTIWSLSSGPPKGFCSSAVPVLSLAAHTQLLP